MTHRERRRIPHAAYPLTVFALLAVIGCHHPTFPDYPANFRQFAYIANSGSNTVTVLDLVYLRPDRTLRVGENPIAIVTNPKKPEAYVLTRSGSLAILDTTNNEIAATIPIPRDAAALSVDPSGDAAYIANTAANTVCVIDLNTRRLWVCAHTPHPTAAIISPDARTLLVTSNTSNSVTLYSASAPHPTPLPITATAPLTLRATFTNCPGATSPVILPDSSKAFIACPLSNQVFAVSLAAAPNSWAAKQNPSLLTDRPLALLDVGNDPTHLTLKPDGGEVFVSNTASGSISEISSYTNEVGNTFPIGDRPTDAIISADNAALWVSTSGADALSLYSIDDGKLISSLHTGAHPGPLAFSVDPPSGQPQRLLLVLDRDSGDVAVIRTASKLGPALFTMLPAGSTPTAIAIQSTASKP